MKILLLFDVDFEINKNRICDFLNNKTTHLKFVNGGDINIDSDIISKPDSFISILNKINKKMRDRVPLRYKPQCRDPTRCFPFFLFGDGFI